MVETNEERPRGLGRLAACTICILPFLPALGRSSWVPSTAWLLCSAARLYHGDRDTLTDSVIFGSIGAVLLRSTLLRRWQELSLELHGNGLFTTAAVSATVPLVLFGTWLYRRVTRQSESSCQSLKGNASKQKIPGALIFPCRTTHARMFPQRHAFGYSYLLYGTPITNDAWGTDASSSTDVKLGSWWMHLRAADYLDRGNGEDGFRQKLRRLLQEKGVEDSEWSHAYLVTAPRFFGYSFNPVSFWYIYDQSQTLKRMILEVNNTFGERRVYLLDGPPPNEQHSSPEPKFTDSWAKDFHVSPFNSRKGSYVLKALDPFATDSHEALIDNTITLKSSEEHAKVVARVYSTGPPIDASNLSVLDTVRFVGGWWWVGLLTFPRILKEASQLYFQRGLDVWFRPEVLSTSISREPSSSEITTSKVFCDYLQHLADRSSDEWRIIFHTAIPTHPKHVIHSGRRDGCEVSLRELELGALTPAFYSRLVHYARVSEAFDREFLFTDEKNRTLWVSRPDLLPPLLPRPSPGEVGRDTVGTGGWGAMRWALLRLLRCPPSAPAYPESQSPAGVDVSDIRTLAFSDLDIFVRARYNGVSPDSAADYRRTVTREFLAQRFCWGLTGAVDAVDLSLRVLLCYAGAKAMAQGDLPLRNNWFWAFGSGVSICACHFYGLAKG